jgi:predicted dehydrogenase
VSNFSYPKSLNIGLVGAGPWGRNYISTISKLSGINLTRLASSNPDSANKVGPECVISEKWQDVVNSKGLDGIVIASPPTTHAEIAIAAINNGLAVLLEKPMTLSVRDSEKLLSIAQDKEAIVMVNHIHLYSSAWEAIRREAQELGAIQTITSIAGKWGPFPTKTPVLWEWGSHDVAMCINLMGRVPDKVFLKRIESNRGGETLNLVLDFGDANARLNIGNLYREPKRLFTISFNRGELTYDDTLDGKNKLRFRRSQEDPGRTFKLDSSLPLELCIEKFRDLILRGTPDWDDVILGNRVTKTLGRLELIL